MQPVPEGIGGLEPPGDCLRVRQRCFLALSKPLRCLEVQQVVVLPLLHALGLGLLGPLVAAILAFHAARHVYPAQLLDRVVAYSLTEDALPGVRESPEAGGNVRADVRAL